jgi:Spy/CpxP family protein refolding chaperone
VKGDLVFIRLFMAGLLATGFAFAQRGRGGIPDAAGSGEGVPTLRPAETRLDVMATTCRLSKDQKKQFKTILNAGSKDADGLRKQVAQSKSTVETAIVAGKSSDEIRKLVEADASLSAQMTEREYKAFSELYKLLEPDQKKQGAQRLFGLMKGIFAAKSWDY